MIIGATVGLAMLFMRASDDGDGTEDPWRSCLYWHARSMDDGKSDIEAVGEKVAQSCYGAYRAYLASVAPAADAATTARIEESQRTTQRYAADMVVKMVRSERRGR